MNSSAEKQNVTVRRAVAADAPVMLELIDALAKYESLEAPDEAARERLVRDAFGERPRFDLLLAESADGRAIGYAFLVEIYSSFKALPTLYLEDIFVLPDARGIGAGFALFQAVVREAERRGCGRVDFLVLSWNQLARDFYHRLGAEHLSDWFPYRLSSDNFAAITGTNT
jgi:GNAT superfamily N-acetyltransferase